MCLSIDVDKPKQVKEIKLIGFSAGYRLENINISSYLSRSKGLAIRTAKGWELSTKGRKYIKQIINRYNTSPTPEISQTLRDCLDSINEVNTRNFVIEAIACYENDYYRSAVVLSWVGALSVLYNYVISNSLTDFNQEASRRNSKWIFAKNQDDLARMKESDFLDILEAISVIGRSMKKELKACLDLRNGCGHPNSLRIRKNSVASHLEILILNVFSKFT